jgi:uncharacterized protein YkwD
VARKAIRIAAWVVVSAVGSAVGGEGGGDGSLARAAPPAAPARAKGTVVVLAERPEDVAGLARGTPLPLDGRLKLAGGTVAFAVDAAGALTVDAEGTGAPKARVVEGRPVAVVVAGSPPPLTLSLAFERERAADGSRGAWLYRVASALRLVAGDRTITLVDVDGDGSAVGDADAVWPARETLMTPIRRPLIAADARWTLEGADLARPDAGATAEPVAPLDQTGPREVPRLPPNAKDRPVPRDPREGRDPRDSKKPREDAPDLVGATLARVNRFRRRTGLPEVEYDATISAACAKHHAYLVKNGWDDENPHSENPKKPGYTSEGAAAAANSVLGRYDGPDAVEMWTRTYFHRAPFMVPGCARVGFATGSGFTVLDARAGVREAPWWHAPYVRSPAPGERDVPHAFWPAGEMPPPVENPAVRGHAIAVLGLPGLHGVRLPSGVVLAGAKNAPVATLAAIPDPTGCFPLLGGSLPEGVLSNGTYEASFAPTPGAPPMRWTFTVGR